MRRTIIAAVVLALTGPVVGCSAGTDFSQATVDQLRPGVTTYDQAVAQMGKPYSVQTDRTGRRLAIWSYASTGSTRGVSIVFDAKGVMERIASRTDSSGAR